LLKKIRVFSTFSVVKIATIWQAINNHTRRGVSSESKLKTRERGFEGSAVYNPDASSP
jgi:hypothetical protein